MLQIKSWKSVAFLALVIIIFFTFFKIIISQAVDSNKSAQNYLKEAANNRLIYQELSNYETLIYKAYATNTFAKEKIKRQLTLINNLLAKAKLNISLKPGFSLSKFPKNIEIVKNKLNYELGIQSRGYKNTSVTFSSFVSYSFLIVLFFAYMLSIATVSAALICIALGFVASIVIIPLKIGKFVFTNDNKNELANFPKLNPNPVLSTDAQGLILRSNPAASKMAQEIFDDAKAQLLVTRNIKAAMENSSKQYFSIIENLNTFYIKYNFCKFAQGFYIYLENITPRMNYKNRLEHLAYFDSETNLPNNAKFKKDLKQIIEDKQISDLKLILIEIDNFHRIVSIIGHEKAKILIGNISERWHKIFFNNNDLYTPTLYAFSDGYFACVLNDNNNLDVIIKDIQHSLEQVFQIEKYEFFLTCSIGVAGSTIENAKEELINKADLALIRAKTFEGNKVIFYKPEFTTVQMHRLFIENNLRKCLNGSGFSLNFQPKLDLKNNKISSFESLLRWSVDNKKIFPDEFINIAEDSGLILQLTPWLLKEVAISAKYLKAKLGRVFRIAINISALQLFHGNLAEQLKFIISEYDLSPEQLEIEITETAAIGDINIAIAELNKIKSQGVAISLDDFGVGYSSLQYLQKLPIDYLKIDKIFINDITENPQNAQLVKAIINTAKSFKFKVIAEGIETLAQKQLLETLGCDYIQGYLISKPIELSKITKELKNYL